MNDGVPGPQQPTGDAGSTAAPGAGNTLPVPRPTTAIVPSGTAPRRPGADLPGQLRRLSRLGLGVVDGAIGAVWSNLTPDAPSSPGTPGPQAPTGDPPPATVTDTAIGALAMAREVSLAAAATTGAVGGLILRRAGAAARTADLGPLERLPGVAPLAGGLRSTLAALGEAGRAERNAAASEAGTVLPKMATDTVAPVLDALASRPEALEPLLDSVVDSLADDPARLEGVTNSVIGVLTEQPTPLLGLIGEVAPPVTDDVMALALDGLAEQPDAVRSLVWDQSGGLAQQLAGSFRSRAVSGDDAIDRFTLYLRRLIPGHRRRARRVRATPVMKEPSRETGP